MTRGALHHLELWVADLDSSGPAWGWLLGALGYSLTSTWSTGQTWTLGTAYVVLEQGPDVLPTPHERRRPGLNHVAFWAGSRGEVDALARAAVGQGWTLLFADRHPYAGGSQHYAAYLEDAAGFEVELVADS